MKYLIYFELKSAVNDRDARYDSEFGQTKISVTKVVEAGSEKEALQKVIDLVTEPNEEGDK